LFNADGTGATCTGRNDVPHDWQNYAFCRS
jgi:hypothetical protein